MDLECLGFRIVAFMLRKGVKIVVTAIMYLAGCPVTAINTITFGMCVCLMGAKWAFGSSGFVSFTPRCVVARGLEEPFLTFSLFSKEFMIELVQPGHARNPAAMLGPNNLEFGAAPPRFESLIIIYIQLFK